MSKATCNKCTHSIWCPTWAEWKCLVKKRRVYPTMDIFKSCSDFNKRSKDFKESKCQCENCLENENLSELDTED